MMRFLLFLFLWCPNATLSAQLPSDLQSYVDRFAEQDDFRHAFISMTAMDIEADTIVAELNAHKSLVPASSMKLISNLAALDILGADYQYTTTLYRDGILEQDGTLDGNIYIVGSGDPSLASSKITGYPSMSQLLREWVTAIKSAGITCIDGDIIADESIFDSFPVCPSWQWNDLGNYYASGAWGINIRDNQYSITYQQMPKEGVVPRFVSSQPYIPKLVLQHEVNTGPEGSGDEAYIFGGPYDFTKRIVGTIPPGEGRFSIKGSIPDPPLFLAYHLQKALARAKITTHEYRVEFTRKRRKNLVKLHQTKSGPISAMIQLANFESNNLITEAMLKTIGFEKHKSGRAGHGIYQIRKWLSRQGIDISALHMEDGSGLSVRNRVSSHILADLMAAQVKMHGADYVKKYLPRVGAQGTVRRMLTKSSAKGHIWAKSGSMNSILSYTGLVEAKSGRLISFSVIANGFDQENKQVKRRMSQLLTALYRLG